MTHHSIKPIAALALALVLLGLMWALLAQAASPNPISPSSTPPLTNDADEHPHLVWVSVLVTADANLEPFFVGQVYHRQVGGFQRVAGHVPASALPILARQPGVIHIPSGDPPPAPPPVDLTYPGEPATPQRTEPPEDALIAPKGWYENDTQGVRETWNTLGVTGTGVTIAVLDSGVDFGNPALNGRYAVQPTTSSGTQAYAGWPIAFDDRSLSEYLNQPDKTWPINWGWYINADHAITGTGPFTFTHLLSPTHVCTAPGTSQSGRYLLGYHPDSTLDYAPVLAADEAVSGTYDAVYMDLDQDGTFETRMDKDNPVGTLDLTGDGVPDISAGMLYWIADGANPPPGAEAVYGPGAPIPAVGALLAFMTDSTSESGGGHGTMCAGTAVGYDDGGVFTVTSKVASFYDPATYGPLVQGPAPGAKVIAMGNVYAPGSSLDSWYLFTVMGYDGVAGTGDEPQIVTLSFGSGEVDNDVWDWESRYLTALNLTYGADSPLFIQSAGNGGPGYGTLIPPKAATGLIVGGSVQYGTYNAWGISETVSLPSRVNTGDVASFSDRGPGADGTRTVDVVANSMLGTGAYPLNSPYIPDGTRGYVHWRGTSRSAPVVGGMAALVAQGFYQANGRFPSYGELHTLLTNGARDLGYDPLVQGAGQANAFRATLLALAQYGVTIDPPLAVAGDFRGERYPSFAAGLSRGQAQTLTFTVTNSSTVPITVEMDTQHLVQVARYTATIDTPHNTATNYSNGAPDYALNLTDWVTSHPDADLMVVRMTEPFEHFDTVPPTPPSPRNSWRLMIYNWWDDSGDGGWWDDQNSDGRVDWPGEIDGGDEWMRFSYSDYGTGNTSIYLNGTQQEVRVGRPYTRSIAAGSAGIWAGAAHITRSGGDNSTTLAIEVIFYRRAAWPEVTLSANALTLAAGTQATFEATVSVPIDAAYGLHQGIVVVADSPSPIDTGRTDLDSTYRPHKTIIPLIWQVWPSEDGFTLGGTSRADTPYDNGWIGGGFGWQVKESGDWRFYGFDLQDPPAGSVILVHNVWKDAPTDVDTLIFGPTADEFSTANPTWFGPYGLDRVGGTTRTGSAGKWEFSTVTGDAEDWVSAPAQDGLHILAHQAILLGGHQSAVPFTSTVGLLAVEPHLPGVNPTTCNPTCTLTMTLQATLDIPGGITGTHGFGWASPVATLAQPISQGQFVTHSLALTETAYRVDVELARVTSATQLDACLYDDGGLTAGQWDEGDGILSCAQLPDEMIQEYNVTGGQHWIRVQGTQVPSPPATYDLSILVFPQSADGALTFSGLPTQVAAGQTYTFTVQVNQAPSIGQQGLLVLGPPLLPEALKVEIRAVRMCYLPLVLRGGE